MRRTLVQGIVLLMLVGLIITGLIRYASIQGSKDRLNPLLRLTPSPGPTFTDDAIPHLILKKNSTLIEIEMLIPHRRSPKSKYAISLVTPSTAHLNFPGLYNAKAGDNRYDSLSITIDRKYLPQSNGDYTAVLTEIFFEPPGALTPRVLLYPFAVESH